MSAPAETGAPDADDGAAIRAPGWLAGSDNLLARGLAIAITHIEPEVRDEYAARILAHVRFHTASRPVPSGIQFVLPNGALLTVYDQVVGRRRRISFMSPRGPGEQFLVIEAQAWPRGRPPEGGWFEWELSERDEQRLLRRIGNAVEVAYANMSRERRPRTALVDPREEPKEIDG